MFEKRFTDSYMKPVNYVLPVKVYRNVYNFQIFQQTIREINIK